MTFEQGNFSSIIDCANYKNGFGKLQRFEAGTVNTILKGLPRLEILSLSYGSIRLEKLSKMPPKLKRICIIDMNSPAWQRLLARAALDCPGLSELHIEVYPKSCDPVIFKELTKFKRFQNHLFLNKKN